MTVDRGGFKKGQTGFDTPPPHQIARVRFYLLNNQI